MPGILYYQRYLDTLRSINDYYSTFPSNQTTYNYTITGTNSGGWTADISWQTLIIDQVSWNQNTKPNFSNSLVIGYYLGGSTSQYSTGVISLPQYLYNGPILPTSDNFVPITIVQVQFSKQGETFHHRFGLIQNWEPGVVIDLPTNNPYYIPLTQGLTNLIVDFQNILPSRSFYPIGSTATYNLSLKQNPGFFTNTNLISNTVTVSINDIGLPVEVISPIILTTSNFINGNISIPFVITDNLVDINLTNPETVYNITATSIISNNYNFYMDINNIHNITATWAQDYVNQYQGGSANLSFKAQTSTVKVITGSNFNITISSTTSTGYSYIPFNLTINTTNIPFNQPINIFASNGITTSTLASINYLAYNNGIYTSTVVINNQGNYSIYAKFLSSVFEKNTSTLALPNQSNILNYTIQAANTLLTTSTYQKTTQDILIAWTTYTGTLINAVDFFESSTFLGSATWIRPVLSITTQTYNINVQDQGSFKIANNQGIYPNFGTPYWTTDWTLPRDDNQYRFLKINEPGTNYLDIQSNYPWNYWPISKTLYRYKTSNESNSDYIRNPFDYITTETRHIKSIGPMGYNTIGVAYGNNTPPFTNLPRPILIGNDQYILVEYIGYVSRPNRNDHIYRFVPEIQSSENSWNLQRDYQQLSSDDQPNLNMVSFNPNPILSSIGAGQQVATINGIFWVNDLYNDWSDAFTFVKKYNISTGQVLYLGQDYGPPREITVRNVQDIRIANSAYYSLSKEKPLINYYDWANLELYKLNYYVDRSVNGRNWYWIWEKVPQQTNQEIYKNIYQTFGHQVWTSKNPNNIEENERARRANDWFYLVTGNNTISAPAYNGTIDITTINYGNYQTATIYLNSGTIINTSTLTYSWPGTLGIQTYGNFLPFNRNIPN